MAKLAFLSSRYRVLLAGVFSQILCIGVARFAYTPLLPVMQQPGLSDAAGGWLAVLNFPGYMLGAPGHRTGRASSTWCMSPAASREKRLGRCHFQ